MIKITPTPSRRMAILKGLHAMCDTFQGASVIYGIDNSLQLTIPHGFDVAAICDVLVEAEILDPTIDDYEVCL